MGKKLMGWNYRISETSQTERNFLPSSLSISNDSREIIRNVVKVSSGKNSPVRLVRPPSKKISIDETSTIIENLILSEVLILGAVLTR